MTNMQDILFLKNILKKNWELKSVFFRKYFTVPAAPTMPQDKLALMAPVSIFIFPEQESEKCLDMDLFRPNNRKDTNHHCPECKELNLKDREKNKTQTT